MPEFLKVGVGGHAHFSNQEYLWRNMPTFGLMKFGMKEGVDFEDLRCDRNSLEEGHEHSGD
jgi:hypothetical protein